MVTRSPLGQPPARTPAARPADTAERIGGAGPLPVHRSGDDFGCPEIRRIGCRIWTRIAGQGLGAHAHPDHWELHWLAAGRIPYRLGTRRFLLESGDVVLVAPGTEHDGIDLVHHRCRLCWISIAIPPQGPLPGLDAGAADDLRAALTGAADRWAPGGPAVARAMLMVNGLAAADAAPTAMRLAVHAALLLAAAAIAAGPGDAAVRSEGPLGAELLPRLLDRFRANLRAPPSVVALAKEFGVSRTTLYQAVLAATGLAPSEHLVRLRLEAAQDLLRGGATLQAVAERTGFASPQHLSRTFKAYLGTTPGAWRDRDDRPA